MVDRRRFLQLGTVAAGAVALPGAALAEKKDEAQPPAIARSEERRVGKECRL